MDREVIGWISAAILLATLGRQVYSQWRDGTSQDVSKWLFVGQVSASHCDEARSPPFSISENNPSFAVAYEERRSWRAAAWSPC